MNALEDRLRDLYRALADTVDPAEIPDLAVGTKPHATLTQPRRLVTALAAAAAVALVAVLVTVPRDMSARHHAQAAKTRVTTAASAPPFTIVVKGSALTVYRTRTGARVATLAAPAHQKFYVLASGGTARSFLAATQLTGSACHAYFYRFELSANGQPSPLTFLRSASDSLPTAIAATPGGGSYAYSAVHCVTVPPNGEIGISGQVDRTWAYDEADNYSFSLAATADGHTLAFTLASPSGPMLLNTNSTARTVDGASRVLKSGPDSATLAISPDGQTLYACTTSGPTVTLATYSAATGAQARVLHQWVTHQRTGQSPRQRLGQEALCQISLDPTGRSLLAVVTPGLWDTSTLIGFNLRTGASATIHVRPVLSYRGSQVAW